MATTIPAANIKVFPSANDVNSGDTGSGNIVTEGNVESLLQMLPPKNFIISGFDVTRASTTSVSFSAGEAFVSGKYVKTDAAVTHTLDPAATASENCYFYLTLQVDGDLNATGAQFTNVNVAGGVVPPDERLGASDNLTVLLGVADTDGSGAIDSAGDVRNSHRNYGGGIRAGWYTGNGDGTAAFQTQVITIDSVDDFAPSFVYIAGETGSGSSYDSGVIACSGVLPAGPRSVDTNANNMISGLYSCGWAAVSDSTNTHLKTYQASTLPWATGSIAKGFTEISDGITMTGVRPGDFVTVGGDSFLNAGEAGSLSDGGSGFSGIRSGPGATKPDDGANTPAGWSSTGVPEYIYVQAFCSAPDEVKMSISNTYAGTAPTLSMTPSPTATGTITAISAWEYQTSSRVVVDAGTTVTTSSCIRPMITPNGFTVTRTPEGIDNSGMTLNSTGQKYFYWAVSV